MHQVGFFLFIKCIKVDNLSQWIVHCSNVYMKDHCQAIFIGEYRVYNEGTEFITLRTKCPKCMACRSGAY